MGPCPNAPRLNLITPRVPPTGLSILMSLRPSFETRKQGHKIASVLHLPELIKNGNLVRGSSFPSWERRRASLHILNLFKLKENYERCGSNGQAKLEMSPFGFL